MNPLIRLRRWLLPALIGLPALTSLANGPDTVTVAGGQIAGTVSQDGDVLIFKGIPFAAPPVGALRWKAPQPVRPWSGVRRCAQFGASPVQAVPAPFGPWSAEYLIPKENIAEDCLYLNVWAGRPAAERRQTGQHPAAGRPVLVWIYGGGFNSGGSAVPIYDGEATARKGVVFVSFNYRVGPFGFLAHPELTRESGRNASGNYGLMDQIAALQWVRQHIAEFGGNPDNVTIAGQSAGSMSVSCLVASPLAKGLFRRAIAQSGASLARSLPLLRLAEEAGQQIMRALGASSLAELRAKPAAEILQKAQGMRGPVVDGYVLPRPVADVFAAGEENDVELLTGWNEDEGLRGGPPHSAADFRQQMEQQYGAGASAFLRHYPAATDAEATQSQRDVSRDRLFGAPNYAWANFQSQRNKPVYVYRFTRQLPATGAYAQYGAFHTGEVAYAYDNLKFIDRRLRPLNATDAELARVMAAYWINFVRTGDPNGTGLPRWPAYSTAQKQIMALGDTVQARPMSDAARLDFLLGLQNP